MPLAQLFFFSPVQFFQDGSTLAASQRAYHPDEFCKSETLKIGIL